MKSTHPSTKVQVSHVPMRMSDRKTRAILSLLDSYGTRAPIHSVLVVGCGDGVEAVEIAQALSCRVDGIDIRASPSVAHPLVTFHRMDARELIFPDLSFDLVYSFHALEHIQSPQQALGEMRRVLRLGGLFCIGTPNRSRLAGYFTGRNASLRDKIIWNINDWGMRIRGRFRNEFGAHAGFTIGELQSLCESIGPCNDATRAYYENLYPRHRGALNCVYTSGLACLSLPSCYVIGRRTQLNLDVCIKT